MNPQDAKALIEALTDVLLKMPPDGLKSFIEMHQMFAQAIQTAEEYNCVPQGIQPDDVGTAALTPEILEKAKQAALANLSGTRIEMKNAIASV